VYTTIYVMWLTLIFPDLCISVYIYTHYPPLAPAHPRIWRAYTCLYTHVMRLVHTYHTLTSTMREKTSNISTAYCYSSTVM